MDFSNFDFDALDQATRDETLARLSYPVDPNFALDPFYPFEPTEVAWQQSDWQLPNADPCEPQGARYNLESRSGMVAAQTLPLPANIASTSISPFGSSGLVDTNRNNAQDAQNPKGIEEARTANYCTWRDCPSTLPFLSDDALEHHLKGHAQDVLQRWAGETECTWSGCTSKAKFKLLSPLKLHLENVHVHPLLCIHTGCPFKRPFRNRCDLERHVKLKHSQTGVFRCPYKECHWSTKTFSRARKDKWLQHVQDAEHQLDNFCPVEHCSKEARGTFTGFPSSKKAIEHMFDEHGGRSLDVRDFSCAIGGCKKDDPPYLTKDQLARHLVEDHGFVGGMQNIVNAVEATELHQVQIQAIPKGVEGFNCRLCAPITRPGLKAFLHTIVDCCQCLFSNVAAARGRCPNFRSFCQHEFCPNCPIRKWTYSHPQSTTGRIWGSVEENEVAVALQAAKERYVLANGSDFEVLAGDAFGSARDESFLGSQRAAPPQYMRSNRSSDPNHRPAEDRSVEKVVYCCYLACSTYMAKGYRFGMNCKSEAAIIQQYWK